MTPLQPAISALALRVAITAFIAAAALAFILRRWIRSGDWKAIDWRCDEPLTIALITAAAAVLRIPELWRPMGTDEATTFLYYASKPLLIGISVYGSPNNHILHTMLMHGAYRLFGNAEWALRLPALVAGLAMVPLTCLASRMLGLRGGTVAAAMIAAWPALIDSSTDGRGYTLLCCFVLICTAAMAEIVHSGNRAACALFIVAAALGFFTVPVMLYPFAMLIAWGALHRRSEMLFCSVVTIVFAFLLYAPALAVSGAGAFVANQYVRPLPVGELVRGFPSYAVRVWRALFASIPLLLQILIALAAAAALVRRRRILAGATTVLLILLLQRVLPFPRVWLPFLPLLGIAAASLVRIADRAIAGALLVALGLCAVAHTRIRETGELRAVREIVRELRRRSTPADAVLTLPPSDIPLVFYTGRDDILFPDPGRPRVFVVVNRDYGQTIDGILSAYRVDRALRRPTVIRDFGSAVLYVLR